MMSFSVVFHVRKNKRTYRSPTPRAVGEISKSSLVCLFFKPFKAFKAFRHRQTSINTDVFGDNYDIYGVNYDIYGVNYDIYGVNYDIYGV